MSTTYRTCPRSGLQFESQAEKLILANAVAGVVFLLIGVVGFMVPPEGEDPLSYIVFIVGGILITQVIGELLMSYAAKKSASNEGIAPNSISEEELTEEVAS